MANVLAQSSEPVGTFLPKINLDESGCSSDADDILIRSTSVRPQSLRCAKRDVTLISSGTCLNDNVRIYVQKISDAAAPSSTSRQAVPGQTVCVPPALAANKPLTSPSILQSGGSQDTNSKANPQRLCERGQDMVVSKQGIKAFKYNCPPGGSTVTEHDIVIRQFATGGKEAVRTALKQRSQSAPMRREVKVQLLDKGVPPPSERQAIAVSQGERDTEGTVCIAAAATAAALTAAAPLIKAQSDVEARVLRVSEGLQKLQEAEVPRERVGSSSTRLTQLEEQLSALTLQRLQHLERIQEQQLEFQNRLLASALDTAGSRGGPTPGPVPGAPQSSSVRQPDLDERRHRGRSSPPDDPAPRRVVPTPLSQDSRATGSCGQTHLLTGEYIFRMAVPYFYAVTVVLEDLVGFLTCHTYI